MKDYNRTLRQSQYLKHYKILGDKLEAKYSPDEILLYPANEHNLAMLRRRLQEQLDNINKVIRNNTVALRNQYIKALGIDAISAFMVFDLKQVMMENASIQNYGILGALMTLKILCDVFLIYHQAKKIAEIDDMNYVSNPIPLSEIDDTVSLSSFAQEVLLEDGAISLNNCECFTHKDIVKIKKYRRCKNGNK